MQRLIITCVSIFTFTVTAVAVTKKSKKPIGQSLITVSVSGALHLKNQKKEVKTIRSFDQSTFQIKAPNLFRSAEKFFSGYRVLNILSGSDEFSFYIPKSTISKTGEFKVHKKYTNQNYHIQLAKEVKNFESVVSQQVIECTYTTSTLEPRYSTDSDGNSVVTYETVYTTHYGRQQAIVNDRTWQEKSIITIYDESNQSRAETNFEPKNTRETVKELTSCN